MNPDVMNLQCSRCGHETLPTANNCPQCQYFLRAPSSRRFGGWVLIFGGFFFAGCMATAIVALPFLLHDVRVENRFTIGPMGSVVIYGTFAAGLLFGVMTSLTGLGFYYLAFVR